MGLWITNVRAIPQREQPVKGQVKKALYVEDLKALSPGRRELISSPV